MSHLRFVAMGDSRGNDPSNIIDKAVLGSANQSVAALNPAPDFLIFFGDNSALGDDDLKGTNNFTYQNWYDFMRTPPTGLPAQLPMYLVIGNHELYQASLGNQVQSYTCQTGYQAFIDANKTASPGTLMPNITSMPGHENLDYSFTSPDGKSLFVVMDGFYVPTPQNIPYYDPGKLDDAQLKYLSDTLSSSTATTKFVISHNPAFVPDVTTYNTAVDPSMGKFWQIMDDNDVTAVLNGHVHMYSRVMVDPSFTSDIPNPNPNLGLSFKNSIPEVVAGTVGAPLIGTVTNEPGVIYAPASWNWKNLYNYSVVDVDSSPLGVQSVTINSYGSDGSGPWALIDSYSTTVSPRGGLQSALPSPLAASSPSGGFADASPSPVLVNGSTLLQSA